MPLYSICGIDGCGKSLQIRMLSDWLRQQGHVVVVTKAYNEEMKTVLRPCLDHWEDQIAILFIFQALHAQHYTETAAALKSGAVVLADRWDENYLAYHSNFGELASEANLRSALNTLAYRDLLPDIGFVLTVPPAIARKRRQTRGEVGKLEDRPDKYYDVIQRTYVEIGKDRGWHILDATKSPDEIHQYVRGVVLGDLTQRA